MGMLIEIQMEIVGISEADQGVTVTARSKSGVSDQTITYDARTPPKYGERIMVIVKDYDDWLNDR